MTTVEKLASERRAAELLERAKLSAEMPEWRDTIIAWQAESYDEYVLALWHAPSPRIDRR